MQEELLQKISNQLTEFRGEFTEFKGDTENHFKEIDKKFEGVDNQFKEIREETNQQFKEIKEETTVELTDIKNRIMERDLDICMIRLEVDKIAGIDGSVMLMEHEYAKKIDIALNGFAANQELLMEVKQAVEEINNHLKRHDVRIGSMELKAQ